MPKPVAGDGGGSGPGLPSVAPSAALELAADLSDSLLFPAVLELDRADAVPLSHLDALAAAGLYGLAGPPEAGGLGLRQEEALAVIERLASGCLTTTFVWLQHHASVRAVSNADDRLAAEWLRPLCAGEHRAGVAFAGLRRPGPPLLTAEPVRQGWALSGTAPWVTGWSRISVMLVAARVPAMPGVPVVWLLVDAVEGGGVSVERLRLEALDASVTVRATFEGAVVPADRLVAIEPFADWQGRDAAGLRTNGCLALGLALRCASLLGATTRPSIERSVAACRGRLDTAGAGQLPRARAAAAELALAAATSLVIETGGGALLLESVAQLLARQAIFLLVFGQTAAIKSEQLRLRAMT
ncbi:MAG: acyl-CoA dehydrogenase family protein [Acidimicrobiales bacterium]